MMIKYASWLFLSICVLIKLNAADLAWIVETDRFNNQAIIDLLAEAGLADKIAIIEKLAERTDYDFTEIINYLNKSFSFKDQATAELCLEKFLRIILITDMPQEKKNQFINLNWSALKEFYLNLSIYQNNELRGLLLLALAYKTDSEYLALVAEEAKRVKENLKAKKPGWEQEAFLILETIRLLRKKEFLFICNDFRQWARQKKLAQKAKDVAKFLESLP